MTPQPDRSESIVTLRYTQDDQSLQIDRDHVSRIALWREAAVPALNLLVLAGCFVFTVNWLMRYWGRPPNAILGIRIGLLLIIVLLGVRIARRSWQNAGIVTTIRVEPREFTWHKATIWGGREYHWPIKQILRAEADPLNRLVKIRRENGPPLGAFAFYSMPELEHAASRLNQAIQFSQMQI